MGKYPDCVGMGTERQGEMKGKEKNKAGEKGKKERKTK